MPVMKNEAEKIAEANRIIAARKFATELGMRDARRALAEKQQRAAMRTASPAGLAALFPALKKRP